MRLITKLHKFLDIIILQLKRNIKTKEHILMSVIKHNIMIFYVKIYFMSVRELFSYLYFKCSYIKTLNIILKF